jgi:hypothetical protein
MGKEEVKIRRAIIEKKMDVLRGLLKGYDVNQKVSLLITVKRV